MKIEISSLRKNKRLRNSEIDFIRYVVKLDIHSNYLTIIDNNNQSVLFECVCRDEAYNLKLHLSKYFKTEVSEDRFMAEIDLLDVLCGCFW